MSAAPFATRYPPPHDLRRLPLLRTAHRGLAASRRGDDRLVTLTSDPRDPRLTRGVDEDPRPQAEVYLVLSETDRASGFVRPYRDTYRHEACGTTTTMARAIAETYARAPGFYGATYCARCAMHRPVGANGEFQWLDGSKVGT